MKTKRLKKIKFEDDIYEYKEDKKCYINMDTNITLGNDYSLDLYLNDEVEILEDKPSNIKEIELGVVSPNGEYIISINDNKLQDKINELTKAVNYLLEKSDSNE